jgi:hypothetical protein
MDFLGEIWRNFQLKKYDFDISKGFVMEKMADIH